MTIEPARCALIAGATARMPRNTPTTFTSSTRRKSSSEVSASGAARKIPALLSSTSMRPCVSSVQATAARQSSSLLTSCARALARSPSSACRRPAPSPSASVSSTSAPSSAKRRAVAAPMPPAAPVINATFPSSRDADTGRLYDPALGGASGRQAPTCTRACAPRSPRVGGWKRTRHELISLLVHTRFVPSGVSRSLTGCRGSGSLVR